MSLGYIGHCKKEIEDDEYILYSYSGSDWNSPQNDRDAEKAYDGELLINKSIMNWQRTKSKKLNEYIDWTTIAIDKELISVTKMCKNAFFRDSQKMDYIAYRLLLQIVKYVYHENSFPEKTWFIQ